jgi:hypothetical protein
VRSKVISIITHPIRTLHMAYVERQARRVLGLPRKYTEWDLHVAYRALVSKHHPNLGGNRLAWATINGAFDLLRKRFDGTTGN